MATPLGADSLLVYPSNMSKILVTGANGFVGQHLVRELLKNNYEVLAVGGSQMPPLQEKGLEFIALDLMVAEATASIDFTRIDGIIHLAGMTSVGASFDHPFDYVKVNFGIEINLFEAALAQGASPRFIIVSSAMLYDPKAAQPLTEASPILPNSPYAVSKIGQENMAEYYRFRGFEVVITRPFNHIGPGQGLGFIVPDLAKQIVDIERGKAHEVMVGNLDAKRDYTDVRDIVRAYRLLMERGRPGEIYNICYGETRSGHDILTGLKQAASSQAPVKQDSSRMRPSDTPILSGSHSKLTNDTGWQPEIPLEQTLADVITDWRDR